jgi:hypothetical protein
MAKQPLLVDVAALDTTNSLPTEADVNLAPDIVHVCSPFDDAFMESFPPDWTVDVGAYCLAWLPASICVFESRSVGRTWNSWHV